MCAQREAFDRILGNHMLYCTVCDNNNDNCTVHNTTALLDVKHQKRPFTPKPYPVDNSNPFYRYDPDQCILCGRCVEACQNFQVNETLSIDWEYAASPRLMGRRRNHRRFQLRLLRPLRHRLPLQCAHGEINDRPRRLPYRIAATGSRRHDRHGQRRRARNRIWPDPGLSEVEAAMREQRVKETKTVCTYCGVGCSFDIWTKDRHILKVEPGEGPANGISTCVKGKFGWDYINAQDRLTKPLDSRWRKVSRSQLGRSSRADRVQIRCHQNTSTARTRIAFISSSKCTNEESFLMQKLARAVIGTNNIDNCSRYCQSPATMGLSRTVGYGGDSGSISDIEAASLVVIVGSNTAESHPVLATRVKQPHKLRGQRLIVSDLREHEMARRADILFRPNPGTDLVWFSAVVDTFWTMGWRRWNLSIAWVNGFADYRDSLAPFTLEYAAAHHGIPVATLQQVAQEIAQANSVCILWAMGVTQHCGGSDTSTSISNLLLLTGNYMRPGHRRLSAARPQ